MSAYVWLAFVVVIVAVLLVGHLRAKAKRPDLLALSAPLPPPVAAPDPGHYIQITRKSDGKPAALCALCANRGMERVLRTPGGAREHLAKYHRIYE